MNEDTRRPIVLMLHTVIAMAAGAAIAFSVSAHSSEPTPDEPEVDAALKIRVVQCSPFQGATVFVKDTETDASESGTTDSDGTVSVTFEKMPAGQVLVQVTAPGHETFGKLYAASEIGSGGVVVMLK